MDWGAVIRLILGVLGAAFIAGGIVAYRGSGRSGVRAFGASAIGAGVVVWAAILFTIPVFRMGGGPPSPTRVPDGAELAAECSYTEADPLPLTFDVRNQPTPTGFDGRNSANCRFSRPISKVSVTLRNGGGSVHGQTFFIQPPSYEVSFPLPEGLLSERTLELLRPGDYRREMVAIAEDGDTWDITANQGAALRTVTVVRDLEGDSRLPGVP